MTPIEALGRGFKGAALYVLHDKDKAKTSERVAWTHTENLPSNDPNAAWKTMIWTAENADIIKRTAGRRVRSDKVKQPVYTLILPWHIDDKPTKEHMIDAGRAALASVGMEEHQALFVAHTDTDKPHIHIVANTINPKTGCVNKLFQSQRRLSKWASNYERKKGKIRCQQREENRRKLENGQKNVRYHDQVIQNAWTHSDTATGFQAALAEQGYILARGRNKGRYIVVHHKYETVNPVRHIEDVNARLFKSRMKVGLNYDLLPDEAEAKQISQNFHNQKQQKTEQNKDARKEFNAVAQHGAEAKKREALEEWGQRIRERRENMQVKECANLMAKHERQMKEEKQYLKNRYEKGRQKIQKELSEIAQRQKQTGFQRYKYRLTGKSAQDKYRAGYLHAILNRTNEKENEALQAESHASRKVDFRRGIRLGVKDHIVEWKKPAKPEWMDTETYNQIPDNIKVRETKVGGKVLVSTFLEPKEVTKKELGELYKMRWTVELD